MLIDADRDATMKAESGRVLAVGDIHGCYEALRRLMDAVQVTSRDHLIFLGDYIDRGPDSKKVINWLIGAESDLNLTFLRGNHEVMILEARNDRQQFDLWSSYGGFEAMHSYGAVEWPEWVAAIPGAHWQFFERTQKYHETATHLFVHASLSERLELDEQPDEVLFWEVCSGMKPHKSGKPILCGHTMQRGGKPKVYPFGVCIDTGVYKGGWLTCLDVTSKSYWQSNEAGVIRTNSLAL